MEEIIKQDLEFYEILNSFPILKTKLKENHFQLKNIEEGITIKEYFSSKHNLEEYEISIIIKKLNKEIQEFLKNEKTQKFKETQIKEKIINQEEE